MKKNIFLPLFALFCLSGNANELSQYEIPLPALYSSFHPITTSESLHSTGGILSTYQFHWIQEIPEDTKIKLEDGSIWACDSSQSSIVKKWEEKDTIVVSPKQITWGTNYIYVMTNKDRNSSINVSLYSEPVSFGSHTTWIRGFLKNKTIVFLLDGDASCSRWEISSLDQELVESWSRNDSIIVGQNDSLLWWLSDYDHILINANNNHYVRAKFISTSCPPCHEE